LFHNLVFKSAEAFASLIAVSTSLEVGSNLNVFARFKCKEDISALSKLYLTFIGVSLGL
jgi:hypothetical protein